MPVLYTKFPYYGNILKTQWRVQVIIPGIRPLFVILSQKVCKTIAFPCDLQYSLYIEVNAAFFCVALTHWLYVCHLCFVTWLAKISLKLLQDYVSSAHLLLTVFERSGTLNALSKETRVRQATGSNCRS